MTSSKRARAAQVRAGGPDYRTRSFIDWSEAPWIVQTIVYSPFLVTFFVYEPVVLVGLENRAGPFVTTTLWGLSPVNRHLTLSPTFTVTVGTPLERTK